MQAAFPAYFFEKGPQPKKQPNLFFIFRNLVSIYVICFNIFISIKAIKAEHSRAEQGGAGGRIGSAFESKAAPLQEGVRGSEAPPLYAR